VSESSTASSLEHLARLTAALRAFGAEVPRIERWGRQLADTVLRGGRLLAAGNGGSAAEAQHLTGELVGRYTTERRPFSALALHADSSSFTAIGNDYGAEEAFSRQVHAHGRPGDVLLVLTTSGRSPNVLAALEAGAEIGLTTWALTGRAPNPAQELADDALAVDASGPTVQEVHLVAIHLLCAALDAALPSLAGQAAKEGAR